MSIVLKNVYIELRALFNQESVLLKYPDSEGGEAVLVYANKEETIGYKVNYDKVAFAYSKLKKGSHKGRTFVLEGVRRPLNHISSMGMTKEGILF